MTEVIINDADLATLKDKVVLITGGSSGIGLAAAQIALSLGAKVVVGDLQGPKDGFSHPNLAFLRTNVTQWGDLVALFTKAKDLHGHIDHVFANAGVSPKADYLATDVDENGDLKEPEWLCQDINLRGCINTVTLGVFHMRAEQQGRGGSIVLTASVASFQHFRGADYASSKHGNLGFMRGMHSLLVAAGLPIRVNAIAPSWTTTGLVPADMMVQLGVKTQTPADAARSALILMADETRNGQLMHSAEGRYKEVEESIFTPASFQVTGREGPTEDEVMGQALALMGGHYKDPVRLFGMLRSHTEQILDWRASGASPVGSMHNAGGDSSRKSHTKSRNGCMQCKKRKIKCGEEKPHCANCSHRGSPCEYAAVVYSGKSAQQPPVSIFIANLGASDFAARAPQMRFCLKQMRFFHHFLMNVPHPLPLGNRKVWANDIPQVAHEHEYLMHAMLALGAAELNVDQPDITTQSEVLKHRGQAIAGLQRALNDTSSWAVPGHPDAILATCYILVAQSSHMSDATDDFNIAVRGCALVTEKLHREHIRTAFKLGPDDLYFKLRTVLKAAAPRLALIPRPELSMEILKDLAPLIEHSAARPFADAIYRTMEKFQYSPADAYMESLSNFGQWYNLALGVIQCLRDPSEAVAVVILEAMLLANMIWLKVLIPLIIWPRYNEKTNPFPSNALLEASHWIEAVAEWVPLESQHFLAWAQRVCEAVPAELFRNARHTHRKNHAACVAAKINILHNINNQAHTMLGSVLRLASELASWFEGHATSNLCKPARFTNLVDGSFGPIPVPLGQLNHAFSRTLRTKRGPEPFALDESVLDSDRFPFLLFSRLG